MPRQAPSRTARPRAPPKWKTYLRLAEWWHLLSVRLVSRSLRGRRDPARHPAYVHEPPQRTIEIGIELTEAAAKRRGRA